MWGASFRFPEVRVQYYLIFEKQGRRYRPRRSSTKRRHVPSECWMTVHSGPTSERPRPHRAIPGPTKMPMEITMTEALLAELSNLTTPHLADGCLRTNTPIRFAPPAV